MTYQEVRKMSANELERILSHLPEPTSAHVYLSGDFDYSSVSEQAQKIILGVSIEGLGSSAWSLGNPTKEKIIEIYRRERTEYEPNAKKRATKRISLQNIQFYDSENKVSIEITPIRINIIERTGQEPDYISKMRKEAARTGIPLNISTGTC